MTCIKEVTPYRKFMGKLTYNADLLGELTEICKAKDITLGRVEVIGAVKKCRVGFYDQEKREYFFVENNKEMEITSLLGNISLKEETPFVHAHITLSDRAGKVFGGHLAPGTLTFAGEFLIDDYKGDPFKRGFDEETGLPLWEL